MHTHRTRVVLAAAITLVTGSAMADLATGSMPLPQTSLTALYNDTLAPLRITCRSAVPPKVDVDWMDDTQAWTLETSRNLQDWAHIDVAAYTNTAQWAYKVTEDSRSMDFYRLRKVGSSNIYVIGDSISTPGAWPVKLAPLLGRKTFSQAIGGTTSPSMVNRTRGVELKYPLSDPTSPGVVRMKWHRHIADRTQDTATYRSQWAYYSKAVSEPVAIEVYQHGRYIGGATRSLKPFTTDYASSTKTITCPDHGLAAGDRVTFISNDPAYPVNLTVTNSAAAWNFTSTNLPSAIIERRVYFAANVTTNTFEIKELAGDAATLNIGSNASGAPSAECGWAYDVTFTGGTWNVTWTARTKYDDWIWLLEVSANDMPTANAVTTKTIPNNWLLLKQMIEINPRFLIVCPTSGSFTDRGPGSVNWVNFYDTYMPWVRTNFPDNHIDTMALFDALRTDKEKGFLLNPAVPEKLWIPTAAAGGKPGDQSTWAVYRTATAGTRETWVGPGYIPLQLRTSFDDDIHPGNTGNQVIANAVAAKITAKGW